MQNTSAPSPNRPAQNVTLENFTKKAVAFISLSDSNEGFVIALKPYSGSPKDFRPTVRQWGAWMAYWSKLGYRKKATQARGYATTPAEWPHEFDASATMQGDHAAADAFERRWRNERESRAFHAGGVIGKTSKAVSMWNASKGEKRGKAPDSHLRPDLEPPKDVSDFPDANATQQELRDWEARQKDAAA